MAGKTPTELYELIRDLELEIARINERLKLHQTTLDEANLVSIRERLAVLDSAVTELKKWRDELDRRGERIAVLESQQVELTKWRDESARRVFQVGLLFGGSLLTLAIQLAILFLKK